LLSQITSAQLSEWEAYDRLDPIGSWRQDFNHASLISKITNIANAIYCEKDKKPVVTNAGDFMPIWDKEERKRLEIKREKEQVEIQSAEDMKSFLMSFTKVHNERIERKSIPPIRRKP
jgi:hypothetical protein